MYMYLLTYVFSDQLTSLGGFPEQVSETSYCTEVSQLITVLSSVDYYYFFNTYIHTCMHNAYLEWPNVIAKLLNHCRDRV